MRLHLTLIAACATGLAAATTATLAQQAATPERLRDAAVKSLGLLQDSAATWSQQRQCFSCHHQGLGLMAASLAEAHGLDVDPGQIRAQARFAFQHFLRRKDVAALGAGLVGGPITAGYALVALDAAGFDRNDTTDALVQFLLRTQTWDGSWRIGYPHRPPLEDSDFAATALSVKALTAYAYDEVDREVDARVNAARDWLVHSETETTDDEAYRLQGMAWAGVGGGDLRRAAGVLSAAQRPDGGWAQEPEMASDAYATGQALVALHRAGGVPIDGEVYQRGIAYLLEAQRGDGSWRVASRDYPGRPANTYFESGFPHGEAQFISAAATAWAAMALVFAAAP